MTTFITWDVIDTKTPWRDPQGYWHDDDSDQMPTTTLSLYLHVGGCIVDELHQTSSPTDHPGHKHHAALHGHYDHTSQNTRRALADQLAARNNLTNLHLKPAFWRDKETR